MTAPTRLCVEHLNGAALGLGDRRPRLSWLLPDGASHQLAYCVEVNGRALDRIEARRQRAGAMAGRAAHQSPARRMAGQGLDRPRRERLVGTGVVRDRTARAADWVAEWIEPLRTGARRRGRTSCIRAAATVRRSTPSPRPRVSTPRRTGATRPSSTGSGSATRAHAGLHGVRGPARRPDVRRRRSPRRR